MNALFDIKNPSESHSEVETETSVQDEDLEVQQLRARLLDLQEQYEIHKQELGLTGSSLAVLGEGNDNEPKRRSSRPRRQADSSLFVDVAQLHVAIKKILADMGGSCHVDTINEYIRRHWETVRKQETTPYNSVECKKSILANLRSDSTFVKDAENDGCWGLLLDDGADNDEVKPQPLLECILRAIDAKGEACTMDEIANYVQQNWPSSSKFLEQDIKENVRLVLTSNPKFYYDTIRPDYVLYNKRAHVKTSDDSEHGRSVSKRSRRSSSMSRGETPPPNHVCKCGATTPGKGPTCKWRKGPNGDFLCNSCGLQYAKEKKEEKEKERSSSSSSDHKDNKRKSRPSSKDEDEDDDDDDEGEKTDKDSPWICCDECGRWVLAKNDNITDISIYDDSNPNHLDYFCPDCRQKKGMPDPPSSKPRKRSLGENERSNGRNAKKRKGDSNGAANGNGSLGNGNSGSNNNNGSGNMNGSSNNKRSYEQMTNRVSKLDLEEKRLRRLFEASNLQKGADPELYAEFEEHFWAEIAKYKRALENTRDAMWAKNEEEFEKKVAKLRRERELLDAKADREVTKQLTDFFGRKKKRLKEQLTELSASNEEEGD